MPEKITLVTNALTIAASSSLLVERLLEMLKQMLSYESRTSRQTRKDEKREIEYKKANETLAKIRKSLEEYDESKDENKLQVRGVPDESAQEAEDDTIDKEGQPEENFERYSPVIILPASPQTLNELQIKVFLMLMASGLGIAMAEMFNLRLLALFLSNVKVPHLLDVMFSGIVIGGGSQPIHALIRFLTTRKIPEFTPETKQVSKIDPIKKTEKQATLDEQPEVLDDEQANWLPISYHGGVNPSSLENRNHRTTNPTLVVFHHTAMSSNLSFQDVVDEFLVNKKWSTGYHCVIMPNGNIRPFCRWDRRGNHAKGLNTHSLGVAFHGNFHTLENDQYSNYDGRFGNQKPTPLQLDSGARLVALWVNLYEGIELDFKKDILAHKEAIPGHTVCPGSNFPYIEFEKRVAFFCEAWEKSDAVQKQIESFKKKPFLYI